MCAVHDLVIAIIIQTVQYVRVHSDILRATFTGNNHEEGQDFTEDVIHFFQNRQEEGYDIPDPRYLF